MEVFDIMGSLHEGTASCMTLLCDMQHLVSYIYIAAAGASSAEAQLAPAIT